MDDIIELDSVFSADKSKVLILKSYRNEFETKFTLYKNTSPKVPLAEYSSINGLHLQYAQSVTNNGNYCFLLEVDDEDQYTIRVYKRCKEKNASLDEFALPEFDLKEGIPFTSEDRPEELKFFEGTQKLEVVFQNKRIQEFELKNKMGQ